MAAFHCKDNFDTTRTPISHCIDTLVEVSELHDLNLQRTPSRDLLSPWIPARADVTEELGRRSALSHRGKRTARRRPHTTPASLSGCVLTANGQSQKTAKFRGVLRTLLTSQRHRGEPSFQHLTDTQHYIQRYRATRHPGSAADDVRLVDGSLSPSAAERVSGNTAAAGTGDMTSKRCSRAERGCPHYTPRSPCVKRANQSDAATHHSCTASTAALSSRISVKGKQVESGQNHFRGERGRTKFRLDKDRKTIIVENRNCKRLRVSWRQYLKYFSKTNNSHHKTANNENDVDSGYTERPATPSRCQSARAATCVPVLDFDQSRIGTPESPFRVDHSGTRKHVRSASSAREVSPRARGLRSATCARLTICTVMDIQEAIQQLTLSLGASQLSSSNV